MVVLGLKRATYLEDLGGTRVGPKIKTVKTMGP